jgi:hypothetical protein
MSLEKQLKEEKVARNQIEEEREESGTHWMQTSIENQFQRLPRKGITCL